MKNINMMTLNEVLQKINDDTTLLQRGSTFGFAAGSPLHKLFTFAYIPEKKFLLPEGDPPYTPSVQSVGMTGADLLVAIRRDRLNYFVDKAIQPVRREQLFISLLETVYAEEAKVLLAVKDQCLDKLYPNLTYKTLYQYGYLPYDEQRCNDNPTASFPEETTTQQPTKRGRGRPKGSSKKNIEQHDNAETAAQ